ncbi:MAG TPA: radical SAM protein [Pyrinomonadaceae bacterium]|nr:radical SAM protein [Pyrinomonadaceae bacterium]
MLGSLSTLLKRDLKHATVKMLDPNWHRMNWQASVDLIQEKFPEWDVLITECSALTYPDMTRLMQWLKPNRADDRQCWLAGPYGMANRDQARFDGWDHVLTGEYEWQVLRKLQGSEDKTGLNSHDYIDLDWLPWPEDEDISRISYSEWSNPYPGMIQTFPTRGCPLACSFCVVPTLYGGHGQSFQSHRCRSVENVCDEIEYLARKYEGQFSGCFFNEETHNANADWLASFADRLIGRGLSRFKYDAMCGYWNFTEELIMLLSRAGYCQIRIGIENFSQEVGKKIGKRIIPEKLGQVLEWCKAAGIAVYGTTQVGAPGSTFESDVRTLQTMVELRNSGYIRTWQNSVSTPQPGTPMFEAARKEGRLLTEDVSLYDGTRPVMNLPGYPAEKIMEAKRMFGA